MNEDWSADLDSSTWEGRDLKFSAASETGQNAYIIRAHRLRDVAQRTSAEALALNLPLLRPALVRLARHAQPGETLTLN